MHGHNVNMQGMVCFEVKNWGNYIEVYCRKREKKAAEKLPCTLLTFAPLPTWGTCAQNYLELLSEQVRAEL
jgi:hypothetical protein